MRPALNSWTVIPKEAQFLAARLRNLEGLAKKVAGYDPMVARLALALEELAEWTEAYVSRDLVAAADAWADRAYVLIGDAVACGFPHKSCLRKSIEATCPSNTVSEPALGRHTVATNTSRRRSAKFWRDIVNPKRTVEQIRGQLVNCILKGPRPPSDEMALLSQEYQDVWQVHDETPAEAKPVTTWDRIRRWFSKSETLPTFCS